jgi:hypothetical protein
MLTGEGVRRDGPGNAADSERERGERPGSAALAACSPAPAHHQRGGGAARDRRRCPRPPSERARPAQHPDTDASSAETVVIRLQAAYDAHDAQRRYSVSITSTLYGPFASLAAVQDAVASSTNGPPSGTGLPLEGGLSTTISGVSSGILTDTFHLPRPLSPGFYDIGVIATLSSSRAAARTDVPLQIVAGG